MPVSLAEIARAAGVSTWTASRALSGRSRYLREETRLRVLQLAHEMGYIPNLAARGLRGERTFTAGLALEGVSARFTPAIVRGIVDHLQPAAYSSIITNSGGTAAAEQRAIQTLTNHPCDGLIFIDHPYRSECTLPAPDKPCVFVNRHLSTAGPGPCPGHSGLRLGLSGAGRHGGLGSRNVKQRSRQNHD